MLVVWLTRTFCVRNEDPVSRGPLSQKQAEYFLAKQVSKIMEGYNFGFNGGLINERGCRTDLQFGRDNLMSGVAVIGQIGFDTKKINLRWAS